MSRARYALLLSVAMHGAMAASEMPNTDELQREMDRLAPERKALFDPDNPMVREHRPSFPNVPTPPSTGLDPEALARRFQQEAKVPSRDALLFFVSFSMPEASLRRVLTQARQLDATVLFRGLKGGSLRDSAAAIRQINPAGAQVQIHPEAFTQYKVSAVPTTLLTRVGEGRSLDGTGCALPDTYVAIAGDVSADYALQEMAKQSPLFKSAAERLLRDLGTQR